MAKFVLAGVAIIVALVCVLVTSSVSSRFKVIPEIKTLTQQITALNEQKKYVQALSLADEALALADTKCKANSISHAAVFHCQAIAYLGIKEPEKAVEAIERSLLLNQRILGQETQETYDETILAGDICAAAGNLTDAKRYYIDGLNLISKHSDPYNTGIAYIRSELGYVYLKLGDGSNSERQFTKAIDILSRNRGIERRELVSPRVGLAMALEAQKKWKEAEDLYLQELPILQKSDDTPSRLDAAAMYEALSRIYGHQELRGKSLEYAEKSYNLIAGIYGENHIDAARSQAKLALANYGMCNFARAIDLNSRAMAIIAKDESISDHEKTGLLIAQSLFESVAGQTSRSETHILNAIGLIHKSPEPDVEQLAYCLNFYGSHCMSKGYFLKAEPVLEEAMNILGGETRKDTDLVCDILASLSECYFRLHKFEKARSCISKALEICHNSQETDDTSLALILRTSARLYREKNDHKTSVEKAQEAKRTLERGTLKKSIDMGTTLLCLARSFIKIDRAGDGYTYAVKAEEIYKTHFPRNHPYLPAMKLVIADAAIELKKYEEAWKLVKDAKMLYENLYGKDSAEVGVTLAKGADIYMARKEYRKAEPLYKKAIGLIQKGYSPNHRYMTETVERLAELYGSTGRPAKSASLKSGFQKARDTSKEHEKKQEQVWKK